jgi:hypothetical protein
LESVDTKELKERGVFRSGIAVFAMIIEGISAGISERQASSSKGRSLGRWSREDDCLVELRHG